jgi:hypothetical protein
MKYINVFETYNEYVQHKNSNDFVVPNISFVENNRQLYRTPYVQYNVGDIIYFDTEKETFVSLTPIFPGGHNFAIKGWIPVGVVVIPNGLLPDKKARIVSMNWVDNNGNKSDRINKYFYHTGSSNVQNLEYFEVLPGTYNRNIDDIFPVQPINFCSLPSDKYNEINGKTTSTIDNESSYNVNSAFYIQSPYYNGNLNPNYLRETINNDGLKNAMNHLNGLGNTEKMFEKKDNYQIAKACYNYKAHTNDSLQWYLPSIGELSFLLARIKTIDASIIVPSGQTDDDKIDVTDGFDICSSTLLKNGGVCYISTSNKNPGGGDSVENNFNITSYITGEYNFRPFAMLP